MFVMVDYVREMTVKKSFKYAEYGSFEHLLFLFYLNIVCCSCCCCCSCFVVFKKFYASSCLLLVDSLLDVPATF